MDRIVDEILAEQLEFSAAVLIEGAKWCGKTTTAKRQSKSILELRTTNDVNSVRLQLQTNPDMVLNGDVPRLIDEWQTVPELWDQIRYEVDERSDVGQFILTGSSSPLRDSTLHSGAGRISRMMMHTMSLFESGESNGTASLSSLFNGSADCACISDLSVDRLAAAMVRGGWPFSVSKGLNGKQIVRSYLDAVAESDITETDGIRQNPEAIRRMIQSIARNISTGANFSKVVREMNGNLGNTNEVTARKYLERLKGAHVIENLQAWNIHIRSPDKLIKSEKWNFADPSIAAAALNIGPESLLKDFEFFDLLFESMCLRDIRVYIQPMNGEVFHFRTTDGFEIDFILQLPDGRWGAAEVKMGIKDEDRAAANLLKIKAMSEKAGHTEPEFLMILTAGKYGYRRPDGVIVVPIGCLKN